MSLILLQLKSYYCELCSTNHKPIEPHNAQSLKYAMWFKSEYKRGVTWADALAHCPPQMVALWKKILIKKGEWTEPIEGTPIATQMIVK